MTTKDIKDYNKSLPTASDASGLMIEVFDSNGNPSKVSIATLATAIADTGKVMRVKIVPTGNIDANLLTEVNTIYTTSWDVGQWPETCEWKNFPTSKPNGSFTLICLQEGSYKRQIFFAYMNPQCYERYSYYNSGTKWSEWRVFNSSALS